MQKIPVPAIIAIVVVVLGIVGYVGYKTLFAPPAYVRGIGPNGQPMSDQDVRNIAKRMSGGKMNVK